MLTAGAISAVAQSVAAWGANSNGQTTLPALPGRVVGVSAGGNHSLAVLEDGTVAAWGSNNYGQSVPPAGLVAVRAVAAGSAYSLALRDDGTVVAWGLNSLQPPASLTGVAAIAAGAYPLALRTDGTVFEWYIRGQSTGRVPATLSGVTAIAAGAEHGLGLQSSGKVVAWSTSNRYGEATVPESLPPVQAIAAGSAHSLALLQDGTVVAWGRNSSGQATVPEGLADVVAIAAGADFSLALKANGSVVGWGSSSSGRLTVPAGTGHIRTLSAGGGHSLAITDSTAAEPPVILSPSVAVTNATGTVASGLSFQHRIVASGAPFNYAAAPLPPGLTLNSFTGLISGVPAQPGYFEIAVSAQNNIGTGTQTLRLWVQGAPRFLGLPAVLPLSVTQDLRDFFSNLPSQWSATGLPPGLSLNPATGVITGSTVQPGVFDVHFTCRNAWGDVEADWPVDVSRVVVLGWQAKQTGGIGRVAAMSTYAPDTAYLREDGTVTSSQAYFNIRQPPGLSDVRSLIMGSDFILAVKADGTVAGWPDQTQSPWGVRLPAGLDGVVATAAGKDRYHLQEGVGLALKNDGTLQVFGGRYHPYEEQAAFQGLTGVVAISAFDATIHALKSDGMVVSRESSPSPFDWAPRPATVTDIVALSTHRHTLALRRNGSVLAWGSNSGGECNVPAGLADVVEVAAGYGFSLALKRNGTVVAWGRANGSLLPPGLRGVVAIAAGDQGLALCGLTTGEAPVIISPAAAITQSDGPTGLGVPFHYRIVATGTPVQFTASGLPPGLTLNATTGVISGVARQAGEYDVILGARNATGTGTRTVRFYVNDMPFHSGMPAMVSAASTAIQLYAPNGPHTWSTSPLPPGLSLNGSTGVISGTPLTPGTYSVTITATNAYGTAQHTLAVEIPTVLVVGSANVDLPRGLNRIIGVAPAPDYPLVLEESGRVSQFHSSAPLPGGLTDVVAVAASRYYWESDVKYAALKSGGQVVAWGNFDAAVKTAAAAVTDAAAIATGDGHLLVLHRNGTVSAWGLNDAGQCRIPPGLGDVVAIAAGSRHSLALRGDGTVVAWGLNNVHQTEVPVGLGGVRSISAGGAHSCALGAGGLRCWGAFNHPFSQNTVAAVASGSGHAAAIASGAGGVAEWPGSISGFRAVNVLSEVAAISAGGNRTIAFHGRPFGARPVILSPRRALTAASGLSGAYLPFQYKITATGRPTSYSSSGLPAGLSLNSQTGLVSGFPADAGEYDITLRATNSAGSGTAVLRLHVLGVPELLEPEISLHAATPVQRQIGVSAAPNVWNAAGLPPGLTMNPATGVLTGTVATPGTHLVALSFSNPRYSGSGHFRLLILPPLESSQAAYTAWRELHWEPNSYDYHPTYDADGDGRNNLLEFALGSDPRVAEREAWLQFFQNSEGRLELEVSVTTAAAAALLIRAQFSAQPEFGAERTETLATGPPVAEEPGRLRLRFAGPGGSARQFGRLVFTLPQ